LVLKGDIEFVEPCSIQLSASCLCRDTGSRDVEEGWVGDDIWNR
jgi:hypothetical protein